MPQVRQHGFNFTSGRVGSEGRTACASGRGDGRRENAGPIQEWRFSYQSWGASRPPNHPPEAAGTTAAGSSTCQCQCRSRSAPRFVAERGQSYRARSRNQPGRCGTCPEGAERDLPSCGGRCARGANHRSGCRHCRRDCYRSRAGGIYAVRTTGSHCWGDVRIVADTIAMGSRGRAGGFRSARFGGSAGGLVGCVPPSYGSAAQRRERQSRDGRSAAGCQSQAGAAAGAVQSPLAARANRVIARPPHVAFGASAAGDEFIGFSRSLVATLKPGTIARS